MSAKPRIDWLAWWQLLRAANVFTAASNVITGFLLVQHQWQPIVPLVLLLLTSVLLYEAGMVLNDVCDAELDSVERPERPIPSDRISKESARLLAVTLLTGGVLIAYAVSWLTGQWFTAQLSIALAATIVGYNVGVKSTPFGPLVMGACRLMNVLLGASIGAKLNSITEQPAVWSYSAAIGIYTVGITYLARSEHLDPSGKIKKHVGTLIQMFIVFDAIVSTLAAGWVSGLAVLTLLIPARVLAQRLPMT